MTLRLTGGQLVLSRWGYIGCIEDLQGIFRQSLGSTRKSISLQCYSSFSGPYCLLIFPSPFLPLIYCFLFIFLSTHSLPHLETHGL